MQNHADSEKLEGELVNVNVIVVAILSMVSDKK